MARGMYFPVLVEGAHGGVGQKGDGAGDITGRRGGGLPPGQRAPEEPAASSGMNLQNSLSGI